MHVRVVVLKNKFFLEVLNIRSLIPTWLSRSQPEEIWQLRKITSRPSSTMLIGEKLLAVFSKGKKGGQSVTTKLLLRRTRRAKVVVSYVRH